MGRLLEHEPARVGRSGLGAARPPVVALDAVEAIEPSLVGSKAASLARSRRAGLPVLAGFVLTTAVDDLAAAAVLEPAAAAWAELSVDGALALAVRSSSPVEDTGTSSMAGRFTTVLDVTAWEDFLAAVERVRASALGHPMAVLVQPMIRPRLGGVLFGADPVAGGRRLLVAWHAGGPDDIVSGRVSGSRARLSARGRHLDGDPLDRASRRSLARLARMVQRVHGGPQDVEWAIDDSGLVLLQARPITTRAAVGSGPVLGRGLVSETLPDRLRPLEVDLWVQPLRAGVAEALRLMGAVPRKQLDRSPVIAEIGGWVVADLDLLEGRPTTGWRRIDPRPSIRRLAAAWTVGRLRRALPTLSDRLIGQVDRDLAAVPPLAGLDDEALLAVIDRAGEALRSVHAYEILAGALLSDEGGSLDAAALRALEGERRAGRTDDEIVARRPEVLALLPPRVPPAGLPPSPLSSPVPAQGADGPAPASATNRRESLRLRARWIQELQSRAAVDLGRRLNDRGVLPRDWSEDASAVALLSVGELSLAARSGVLPADLGGRARSPVEPEPPTRFRLTAGGRPVAVGPAASGRHAGTGAGGGRGVGVVGSGPGSVLVVANLDPALALELPGRAGLVAETGSILAHLAILARELGVPVVVGVVNAVTRFPPGTTVLVDGGTGEVAEVLRDQEHRASGEGSASREGSAADPGAGG